MDEVETTSYESEIDRKRREQEAVRVAADEALAKIGQRENLNSKQMLGTAFATILPIIAGSVIGGKRGALIGGAAGAAGGGTMLAGIERQAAADDAANTMRAKNLLKESENLGKGIDGLTKNQLSDMSQKERDTMLEGGRMSRAFMRENRADARAALSAAGKGSSGMSEEEAAYFKENVIRIKQDKAPVYPEGASVSFYEAMAKMEGDLDAKGGAAVIAGQETHPMADVAGNAFSAINPTTGRAETFIKHRGVGENKQDVKETQEAVKKFLDFRRKVNDYTTAVKSADGGAMQRGLGSKTKSELNAMRNDLLSSATAMSEYAKRLKLDVETLRAQIPNAGGFSELGNIASSVTGGVLGFSHSIDQLDALNSLLDRNQEAIFTSNNILPYKPQKQGSGIDRQSKEQALYDILAGK